MTKLTTLLAAAFILFFAPAKPGFAQAPAQKGIGPGNVYDKTTPAAMDNPTTFIVLRHAEKEDAGKDPNLNSSGLLRAEELQYVLSHVNINAIYSTPYNRTRQTVNPLALKKDIAITEYPAAKPYDRLINEISAANRGKTVVIVGHSNTVPEILKELSNNTFETSINEDQYDNLFIVNSPDGQNPNVVHLKYGKKTR